ncbi:hypothetical protein K438DRAFT_2046530 [Mycena galopus ATCC 62051]|nr:hypothetical protein K438DRAFT_2046530 [Mycena galopus ATCC 62051]
MAKLGGYAGFMNGVEYGSFKGILPFACGPWLIGPFISLLRSPIFTEPSEPNRDLRSPNEALLSTPSPLSLVIHFSFGFAVVSRVIAQDNSDCGGDDSPCAVIGTQCADGFDGGSCITIHINIPLFLADHDGIYHDGLNNPLSARSSNAADGTFVPATASSTITIPKPLAVGTGEPTAKGYRLSTPLILAIIVGLALVAVLVAFIFVLLRRSRKNRRVSKISLDPEAAPSTKEMRGIDAGTAAPPSYSVDSEQGPNPTHSQGGQTLAQLEHQTRVLQEQIQALRGRNLGSVETENPKCYTTVNAAQKEKFDSLAARAQKLTTYREPDSPQDMPPEYESTSTI